MGHDDIDALLNLPINERGERLAQTQENQWFERKSIRVDQKSFAKAIIGMANAEGGTVVVGLSEKRVEGTNSTPGGPGDERRRHARPSSRRPGTSQPTRTPAQ